MTSFPPAALDAIAPLASSGKCIVFEGPASGSPALFTGSDSWNVVSFKDSSYIAVRNLSLDWHVMLDGYTAYSGLTLVGSYQTSPTCNAISDVEPNNSMTAPQAISGSCNQISGTFLNDASTQKHDYFRLSLPAGRTVTALLNGLTVDYDLEIHTEGGDYVAYSYACCANPDQASWTNTTASAMNVYILVYRSSSTRTTYQLRVSY